MNLFLIQVCVTDGELKELVCFKMHIANFTEMVFVTINFVKYTKIGFVLKCTLLSLQMWLAL